MGMTSNGAVVESARTNPPPDLPLLLQPPPHPFAERPASPSSSAPTRITDAANLTFNPMVTSLPSACGGCGGSI